MPPSSKMVGAPTDVCPQTRRSPTLLGLSYEQAPPMTPLPSRRKPLVVPGAPERSVRLAQRRDDKAPLPILDLGAAAPNARVAMLRRLTGIPAPLPAVQLPLETSNPPAA